ncbi:MAG: cysteine--tRNA ligase [Rhodospirillales bacterium]|nr:cysteine--tRNA ligase [Rhodospirillales bacterium]
MTLKLHNTLTRQKDVFRPVDPKHVRMYVCGPTVYDFAHIGNARPVIVFDVLYRLLKRLYPKVTYVRNITDVDDKIIAAAKESGEPIGSITKRTEQAFHEDAKALGALDPDVEPRATEHIPEMIRMIEALIEKGHAYAYMAEGHAGDGHVLFSVPSMPTYGRLSRHSRDELIAGARVEVAPYKKDPADFVLWKPSTPDLPGWDSPWGRGRPGWHIECSAMSEKYLGSTFDIHGGGLDLIFPHHENEIAQSTCARPGETFARVWVHNGYLMVNGEKMSKSLGNFFTVRDLLQKAPGEVIRFAMLATHYRQPLNWTDDALKQARSILDRWYRAIALCGPVAPIAPALDVEAIQAFLAALTDDLNTSQAIAEINKHADMIFHAADLTGITKKMVNFDTLKGRLLFMGNMLGVLRQDADAWFKGVSAGSGTAGEAEIEALIQKRNDARKAKDFKEADRLRAELVAKGVTLEDGPKGTTWRRG